MNEGRTANIGHWITVALLIVAGLIVLVVITGLFSRTVFGADWGPMGGGARYQQHQGADGMGGRMGPGGMMDRTGSSVEMMGGSGMMRGTAGPDGAGMMQNLTSEEHRSLHDQMHKGMPKEVREAMGRCRAETGDTDTETT